MNVTDPRSRFLSEMSAANLSDTAAARPILMGIIYLTKVINMSDCHIRQAAIDDKETWVTREMVSAGVGALEFYRGSFDDYLLVAYVYKAMHQVRPRRSKGYRRSSARSPEADL